MARPQNKKEMVEQGETSFLELFNLIDTIEDKEQVFNFSLANKKEAHWSRDRNIRDVLVHLYEWHRLLLVWLEENLAGRQRNFLREPYNWRNYGEMNQDFFREHQTTSFDKSVMLLKSSHKEVMEKLDSFNDKELFTKKYYSFTGTTNLASYIISSTSSHYKWAIKKLKLHKKNIK